MSPLDFRVNPSRKAQPNTVYLEHDRWDDYSFQTQYYVTYIDPFTREIIELGQVKIGEYRLESGPRDEAFQSGVRTPDVPSRFDQLDPERFFSLGQDADYYEAVARVSNEFRESYLQAMNDMAYSREIRLRAREEQVTRTSLMRTILWRTIDSQFARLATGGPINVNYELEFPVSDAPRAPRLSCKVTAHARPPENVHVLIGSNGAGKSTTLNNISSLLMKNSRNILLDHKISRQREQLANLVLVSFSAFDSFKPLIDASEGEDGLTYRYIGIKRPATTSEKDLAIAVSTHIDSEWRPSTDVELVADTIQSVTECISTEGLHERLVAALKTLENDLNLSRYDISGLVAQAGPDTDLDAELRPILDVLSSGHRIAVLTIAGLVEKAAERSLVLMDEPEAHLHPPLLSALVRSISSLLTERNGLAIIATHSPVVLQEVPKSCVHIAVNRGNEIELRTPTLETFGENVGTLTGDVFGLEVTKTGFHQLLEEVAATSTDYEEALSKFNRHLGAEARGILRSLIAAKAK